MLTMSLIIGLTCLSPSEPALDKMLIYNLIRIYEQPINRSTEI